MIVFPIIFLVVGQLFLLITLIEGIRISKFSKHVHDIIDYCYAKDYNDYLSKTKLKVIPFVLNRKRINIDVAESYKNFRNYNFWDWDFEKMIVEE